jgi:hypothetical protein
MSEDQQPAAGDEQPTGDEPEGVTFSNAEMAELLAELRQARADLHAARNAQPGYRPPEVEETPIDQQEPMALVQHDGRWGMVLRRYVDGGGRDVYDVALFGDVRIGLPATKMVEPPAAETSPAT